MRTLSYGMEPNLHLIVLMRPDKDEARVKELDACFDYNRDNSLFKTITVFFSRAPGVADDHWLRQKVQQASYDESDRISLQFMTQPPLFQRVFKHANDNLPKDDYVVVAYHDVYFKQHDLKRMLAYDLQDKILVLTPWDVWSPHVELQRMANDSPQYFLHVAWIFKCPLHMDFDCAFEVGTPFCSAMLANQLFRNERRVYNPCLDIKAYHLHEVGVRRWDSLGASTVNKILAGPSLSGVKWCKLEQVDEDWNTQVKAGIKL